MNVLPEYIFTKKKSELWMEVGDRVIETIEDYGPVSEEQSMELYYFIKRWIIETLKKKGE
jgi:hypothetical protein